MLNLFNLIPAAIILVDLSGRIKEANSIAKQLFNHYDLNHNTIYDVLRPEEKIQWAQKFSGDIEIIKDFETTIYSQKKNVDVSIDGNYVLVENEPHFVLILRDITIQKEKHKEITFLAYHDPLTGLPNRRYFFEKLEEAIEEAKVHHHQLAVIIIDLDLLKETNDRYGHKVGDELLQHVARIIEETVAQRGMVARLGGDEFVIFINDIPSVHSVGEFIELLRNSFNQNLFMYEGKSIPIELSIGVSLLPNDGSDSDTLVIHADKAMYQVKRNLPSQGRRSRFRGK